MQHFGPLGRRAFSRSRVQLLVGRLRARVGDRGADHPRARRLHQRRRAARRRRSLAHALNVGSDLDYVLGRHSLRDRRRGRRRRGIARMPRRTTSAPTPSTTSTPFDASRPSNYTRRIGDPNIAYRNVQGGVYLQDDIRVRKNLTLTPGVRYEPQTHVGDRANIGPRFGVTWAPFASGQTTLRGSAGIFYDWLPTGTYEQTLRVDGFRQQELNIVDPSFPDPGTVGADPADQPLRARRRLPAAAHDARQRAASIRDCSRSTRVSATYSYQRGSRLARGLNLNAPIDGVRPDPAFAQRHRGRVRRRVAAASAAGRREHQPRRAAAGVQRDRASAGSGRPSSPTTRWRRLREQHRRPVQPFRATGDLDAEWGPAGAATSAAAEHHVQQPDRHANLLIGHRTSTAPAAPRRTRC